MDDFSSKMGQMARKHGESMREKAQARAKQRKEEYLGARVSKALRERVFQQAEAQNMPVSLLLRQVLEEAFPESNNSTFSASHENLNNRTGVLFNRDDIIAWDEVTLGKDMRCAVCDCSLSKNTRVMLGVSTQAQERPIVCLGCHKSL